MGAEFPYEEGGSSTNNQLNYSVSLLIFIESTLTPAIYLNESYYKT